MPKIKFSFVTSFLDYGLKLIATYRLPEAGWWENYYIPLLERVHELNKTFGEHPDLVKILKSCQGEAEMYWRYKKYYGYTFFVMLNG